MTRGKSAAASARRAQADVVDATDRLRAAEVELRRVGREVAARDREIDQLRSALEQSRREHVRWECDRCEATGLEPDDRAANLALVIHLDEHGDEPIAGDGR